MNVSLNTLSLTRNLQELATQIAEAPALLDEVRAAVHQPDVERLTEAKLRGHRHITAIAMTTRRIRDGVIGVDDLGSSPESLSELALRAVRLVVLSELTILRALWRGLNAFSGLRMAIEQETGNFEAVDARLRDELDDITRGWCQCCGTPNPDRAAYRSALRVGHRATSALAEDREVARFLDAGITRVDWPAFRESSTRLRDALLVRIDVEPDAAIFDHDHLPAEPHAEHAP
jgi:hypothetical protein